MACLPDQQRAVVELVAVETRLLAELREHVAAAHGPRRRRPRWVIDGAAAAALAIAGVVVVPGLGTAPAYSVQEGNAGEIEVEVSRLEDAAGLESALAEHGITADVRYLPWGQACAPGRYTDLDRDLRASIGEAVLRVVLPPGAVREGETLVMWVSGREVPSEEGGATAGFETSIDLGIAAGPVSECEVVPAPG